MKIAVYKQFGATHADTGALRNVLAHLGVTSPHTGEPFSEAMLLGIGGGIGGGYWTFEFGQMPVLVIGTRHQWQGNIIPAIGERLGIAMTTQETTSDKAAETNLKQVIEGGQPAIVWAALQRLPYYAFPLEASAYHTIVVYGWDDAAGVVRVADRSRKPLTLTTAELMHARANTWAPKHRAIIVEPPQKLKNLKQAIIGGIRACQQELLQPPIKNFGLPSLSKWADLVANTKDKKGWPNVFKTNGQLYGAFKSAYFFIELANGRGGLRPLYADFLDEARDVLRKHALAEIAAQYRAAATLWSALAVSALPDYVTPFKETRTLLARKQKVFESKGMAALPELQTINARLDAIKAGIEAGPPVPLEKLRPHLEEMRERILRVHEAEMEAVRELGRVVK